MTPAAAIAWELRQRHRWGWLALLAAFVALGAIRIAVLTTQADTEFHDITFALLSTGPLSGAFFYLLAVFTFGIAGDLTARESMYPARMFTLPVSSAALAGWPMLYGCLAMMLLWLAIRITGTFPPVLVLPVYWPALFGAVVLAWTQAVTWMPYPLRGMRIVLAIALLFSIDVVVFVAFQMKARESTMLLLLAPLIPMAYFVAVAAVSRARRGDVPSWLVTESLARALPAAAAGRDFVSPARAQLWFEWRQYGRSLPLMVALVLPFLLLLLVPFRETPIIVIEVVTGALLLPPFLAVFVAATIGKSSANAAESWGITPFIATRPVTDRSLVVAKWQAALLSTLAAWLVVAMAVPVALTWAGAWEPVTALGHTVGDALGRPRAMLLGILILTFLIGSTWKQLVQGLYLAMSGRDWAVKGIGFATLTLVTVLFLFLGWIADDRYRMSVASNSIPWLMGGLVAVKLVLATGVMWRGNARGLFTTRQLILAALTWDACVLALFGVLSLIVPAILVRRHHFLLIAILAIPFVRLAAAPLAVASNRHR